MNNSVLLYVGQKALIEKDGKVLVLTCPSGWLDFPGGKLQVGEAKDGDQASLVASLKCEVREETGLEIEVREPFAVWYWEFPEGHKRHGENTYLVMFRCKYWGGELKLSDEHASAEWVDKDRYRNMPITEGMRHMEIVGKYFES